MAVKLDEMTVAWKVVKKESLQALKLAVSKVELTAVGRVALMVD